MEGSKIILIGYSGHAYIAYSILKSASKVVFAYCDNGIKESNPFSLDYLGSENSESALLALQKNDFFISIGDNHIRRKIYASLALKNIFPVNAIHTSAVICSTAIIAAKGVMVSAGVIINSLSKIGNGVICNTGCIIEHECVIGDFAHIAPGALLCGNVTIGENSFIGAGAVVVQGITIGKNVIIGAGSIVVKNIPDNSTAYGNPAQLK
jgi:sugar O-acyltransferase (sialic acid O-acetyltransferase NeuD family)